MFGDGKARANAEQSFFSRYNTNLHRKNPTGFPGAPVAGAYPMGPGAYPMGPGAYPVMPGAYPMGPMGVSPYGMAPGPIIGVPRPIPIPVRRAPDEPLNTANYPGTVVGVSYNILPPSWDSCGAPSAPCAPCGQPAQRGPAGPCQSVASQPCGTAPCLQYGDRIRKLGVPRSYPVRPKMKARPQPPPTEEEFEQYEQPQYERYEPEPQYEKFEPEPQYEAYQPEPQYEQYQPEPEFERYEPSQAGMRPWFGVGLKWLDNLDEGGTNNVAVVHEVVPESPAAKAGIIPDDQIEFWNGTKVDGEGIWKAKMAAMRIGDEVLVGLHRNGRDQQVRATIEGTSREKGIKKIIHSLTATHTDN